MLDHHIKEVARGHLIHGLLCAERGEYEEAIENFNEVIGLDPTAVEAYDSRSNVYYALGNYEESHKDQNKAISLNFRSKFCGEIL